jgi:hypothetical protein
MRRATVTALSVASLSVVLALACLVFSGCSSPPQAHPDLQLPVEEFDRKYLAEIHTNINSYERRAIESQRDAEQGGADAGTRRRLADAWLKSAGDLRDCLPRLRQRIRAGLASGQEGPK